MTLKELGEQYLVRNQELIKRARALKKQASNLSGNAALEINRRILSLYDDASYCAEIYEKLSKYYKNQGEKK